MTHLVSRAVVLLGGRGLVLGWTPETQHTNTHTHKKLSSESQKYETCSLAFHLMDQFANNTEHTQTWKKQQWSEVKGLQKSTFIQPNRHSLSIEFVLFVFAVHRYGCPNDGHQHYDSNEGSDDAACSRTLLWKTVIWKNKTRREKILLDKIKSWHERRPFASSPSFLK